MPKTRNAGMLRTLLLAAAIGCLLAACQAAPVIPATLPHYPCERADKAGRAEYFACPAGEWLFQKLTKEEPKP